MSVNQYETMTEALARLRERGFTAGFQPVADGLRDPESGKTFRAEDLRLVEFHRFEGATDPDDMAVVYAFDTRNGVRGVVVDAYGPYADPALGEVLRRVHPV